MTQDPQVAQGVSESADDALIACLTEIERFVASSSWGGPPRLFALVRTVDLVKAEPALAGQLAIGSHDSLSSIEQDDFRPGEDLAQALAPRRGVMLWMGPLSASRGYSYPMTAPMRYLTIRKKLRRL